MVKKVSPLSHAMEGWLERLSEQMGWLLLIKKISNRQVNTPKICYFQNPYSPILLPMGKVYPKLNISS
jgi:hypothetical protein